MDERFLKQTRLSVGIHPILKHFVGYQTKTESKMFTSIYDPIGSSQLLNHLRSFQLLEVQ